MGIGIFLTAQRDKLGFKNFADMARAIGVTPDFLNNLKTKKSKEELKQINIEHLEKISNYLNITINELINGRIDIDKDYENYKIKYTINCYEVCDILNEVIQKTKNDTNKNELKFEGILMTQESKDLLIDGINIVKDLIRNKL